VPLEGIGQSRETKSEYDELQASGATSTRTLYGSRTNPQTITGVAGAFRNLDVFDFLYLRRISRKWPRGMASLRDSAGRAGGAIRNASELCGRTGRFCRAAERPGRASPRSPRDAGQDAPGRNEHSAATSDRARNVRGAEVSCSRIQDPRGDAGRQFLDHAWESWRIRLPHHRGAE